LYNKYIIIITAENKEKYIINTIQSCLKTFHNKQKIIVIYTKLLNEKYLKSKFSYFKNIIFLKNSKKKRLSTQDQIYKIEKTIKFINNEWILLLDGDDVFKFNKIKVLDKLKVEKSKIYLHDHDEKKSNLKLYQNKKYYKKFFIYKKFFNDWPEKINTSSIVVSGNLLKNFYKKANPYQWKFLAIDVQLILYYFYKNKFEFIDQNLTTKLEDINNLDKNYSNKIKKNYWLRRKEQHDLTLKLSGKKNLIDRLVTKICLKLFFK
jgi:hypothetical protein